MNYQFSDKIAGLQPSAIREILKFTSDPSVISFAAGNPSAEAFPVDAVREITAKILAENPILALQYGVSEGYTPLRDTMKKYIKENYGIGRTTDELIIVSGAQQGIELSCKILCNEGDTVLCENPSFIGSLNSFRSYNVNLEGIPMDDDGINIEQLEKTMREIKNEKLLYVIPNFQNPTGICMSLEKRKAVYQLAKRYGVFILEDNPYGDLRFDGEDIPSIKSLDTDGIVIYCGSFSKILSPGMRVGYVCAPSQIISKLIVAKQVSDVHTNMLAQLICNEFVQNYDIKAHIEKNKILYRNKCNLMLSEMKKHFPEYVKHITPQGGLFIWCTLPNNIDMLSFCKNAVEKHKIAVVPGTAFLVDETKKSQSFRLNFSTPSDELIVKGIEILGSIL